ncbi:MAG: hypothetical protein AAGC85_07815 [Bacteroidota bacterium]
MPVVTSDQTEKSEDLPKLPRVNPERINLTTTLLDNQNDYLLSLEGNTLSLCCYELLDISIHLPLKLANKTVETYESEGQLKEVNLFQLDSSFVKIFYNDHPRVMREEIVCGRIKDNNFLDSEKVDIGMPKEELFRILFHKDPRLTTIDTLEIYEDELGNAFTSYIFREEKLKEIILASDYDWIDRDIKP